MNKKHDWKPGDCFFPGSMCQKCGLVESIDGRGTKRYARFEDQSKWYMGDPGCVGEDDMAQKLERVANVFSKQDKLSGLQFTTTYGIMASLEKADRQGQMVKSACFEVAECVLEYLKENDIRPDKIMINTVAVHMERDGDELVHRIDCEVEEELGKA